MESDPVEPMNADAFRLYQSMRGPCPAGLRTAFECILCQYVAFVTLTVRGCESQFCFGVGCIRRNILTRKKIRQHHRCTAASRYFSRRCGTHFERVCCPCRAALVVPEHGGVQLVGRKTGGFVERRLLVSLHSGSLNGMLGGWQWGMKLMQEMLLA